MAQKIDNSILSKEELEFLSELLLRDERTAAKKLQYNISSSTEEESLLFQLGRAHGLQLTANYGNHHLVFPVQVEIGDFANLQMTLEAPEIFENGNRLRPWRLIPNNQNIYLVNVNEAGEESHFQIKDLSASGISFLIGEHTQTKFPAVLDNVFLLLPNRERLAISGLQISRVDQKSVAYSWPATIDKSVLAALYEYLFECHTQQYAAVQP